MASVVAALRPALSILLAAALLLSGTLPAVTPAYAQGGQLALIRDTEAERVLRSYLNPLLVAAGLEPSAVRLYIINDSSINAFVTGGQNMFVHTGLVTELESPNQVIGVMAHETGHLAAGHLVRMQEGMRAAMVPMLLSMAVGLGAMIAGAGDAGALIMMSGQGIAMGEFFAFTRTQESAADQAALRYLDATEQSGEGMVELFRRLQDQEILSYERQEQYARSHPAPADRVIQLRSLVEESPYFGKEDSAETRYAFDMLQAKLRGYINRPATTLRQYPITDQSRPGRYARAMAYFRQPNMTLALAEIESLIAEEPDNPYFLEMYGQINVEMGRVADGIAPYQKAVAQLPDAPLIRVALGAALLGTENPAHVEEAAKELEMAVFQESDNAFGWYELAAAYNRLGRQGEAQLATAERYFAIGAYPQAMEFAYRAEQQFQGGTRNWQRANDIMAISQAQAQARRRN